MLDRQINDYAPDVCLLGNIDFLGNHETINTLTFRNIPVVHHLGGMFPGYDSGTYPRSPLYRPACASGWLRDELWRHGYGLDKIDVVYPGARTREFYFENTTPLDKLRIAYAGIVLPYKGIHLLINALAKLHIGGVDFEAVVAGTTTDAVFRDKLIALCRRHGMESKIQFVGNLDREQLKQLYKTRNVLVFPSICKEAFGISQVEAMASGVCVVTSGTGGAAEIVEHERSGVVFETENADSLFETLAILTNDPGRWDKVRQEGQRRALEAFDIEQSVDKLEEIFLELISTRSVTDR
jgi:glycosyltransferase involved in cell wall biosynthesis